VERENRTVADALLWRLSGVVERKRGWGSGVGTVWRAGIGKRDGGGGAGTVGDSSGGTGRQRDPVGSDGVRERVRESGATRWWALTRGPGQHSAGRRG
jgi:hypothetical protein